MSPTSTLEALLETGAPRVSGDEPDEYGKWLGIDKCSPRERG